MKKIISLIMALAVLASCGAFAAPADTGDPGEKAGYRREAKDLTPGCTILLGKNKNPKNIRDKSFSSQPAQAANMKNPTLTIQAEEPVYGLYLCFSTQPEEYELQVNRGGGWETLREGDPRFVHAYYELDGETSVRVYARGDKKQTLGFNEVYVFGEGRTPDWVQRWEDTPEHSDILFVTAQPEDELLYLGGAIPYYTREKESTVAVACFNFTNTSRRSELLNGLWSMGYRYYPIIGDKANGKDTAQTWLTEAIRRCRPQVIVGPDVNGEGKNKTRMLVSAACEKCFYAAGDETLYTDSAAKYGAWQAKKLYLHLYGTEGQQTVFDWDTPMESLGGLSGNGLAYYAYLYHKTQDNSKEKYDKGIYNQGRAYASNVFGLKESTVGGDEKRKCFLENIPEGDLTPAKWTAPEKWSVQDVPGLPELNEKGFLNSGEFVWADDEQGKYVYISATLRVEIQRVYDGVLPLTWFRSEIRCDTEAGEYIQNYEYSPEKKVGDKAVAYTHENALKNHLVFATNGDYYTYRIKKKGNTVTGVNGRPVGVEIRGGEVYFDSRYNYDEEKMLPNLDTLAFYRDGSADVHHSVEMSAKDYLDRGAYLVYSFGPYLVRDGMLSEWVTDPTKSKAKNPRHCFGMVEPGHYIDILCEGRLASSGRSEGVTTPQIALLAQGAGCKEVCNLDGGATASLSFMGTQLNMINGASFSIKKNGQYGRANSEVIGAGVSDLVGVWEME